MKSLSVFALVVFGVALASHAEIVTVPFNGYRVQVMALRLVFKPRPASRP